MLYAKHFRQGAVARDKPKQSTTKLHKLGKNDFIFPLSLTVIIFLNAKQIKGAECMGKAMGFAREIKPISAFVQNL